MKTSVLTHPREGFCLQFRYKHLPLQLPNNLFALYSHPECRLSSEVETEANHKFLHKILLLVCSLTAYLSLSTSIGSEEIGDSVGPMCVITRHSKIHIMCWNSYIKLGQTPCWPTRFSFIVVRL